jgi:hypothetical protein
MDLHAERRRHHGRLERLDRADDPDPLGRAAGNRVMVMNPGSPYPSDHRSRLIGRPPPINYGTTGTVFYRWYTATVNRNGTQARRRTST